MRKTKKKLPSIPALTRKLDTVFSRYIRMSQADETGTVECVTCGKLMHWKESHCAHFVSRRHMSLRWSTNPPNCHTCCPRCNVFEAGNMVEYSAFILRTYGQEVFDKLLSMKRETRKWTRGELMSLIDEYESAAREQATRIGAV